MKTGRPRKPTKLKILEGNPGRRPLNHNEPQPREGVPSRPQWLSAEAKREWMRIVPELERLGLLTIVDRGVLAAYCDAWGRYVTLSKYLAKAEQGEGFTYTMTNGCIAALPQIAMRKEALAEMSTYGVKLGLDPASRSRISLPAPKEEDALDAILRGTG